MAPDPAPAVADGHRRGRGRRVLLAVLAVLGVIALMVAVAAALVTRSLESNVERERVFTELDEQERPDVEEATEGLTLLVLGSDDREGNPVGREFRGPPGDFHAEGKRADTTLLVRLTADREAAWVVSIPRDSWVRLPSCRGRDGERLPARDGQFALAYRDGGLACTVRAVEALTDVRVDHTVVVDFSGFVDMVEALGGVPVCLDEPFRPREVGLRLPAGRHVLEPEEALDFVRARYGVDDGSDLARIERQKQFMAAMVERARSRALLLRPDKLLRFVSAVSRSLQVDEDLDVRRLALSLRGLDPERVLFTTVPIDRAPDARFERGGPLFGRVAWEEDAAAELFTAFERDRFPTDAAEPPADAATGAPSPGASPSGPSPTASPGTDTDLPPTRTAAEAACS